MLKRKRNKILFVLLINTLFLLLLIVISVFFARVAYSMYTKYSDSKKHELILKNKYKDLLEQKTSLEKRLNDINSSYGREYILRNDFNLAREGEKMVIIFDDKTEDTDKKRSDSNYYHDWYNFFTKFDLLMFLKQFL